MTDPLIAKVYVVSVENGNGLVLAKGRARILDVQKHLRLAGDRKQQGKEK